MKKILSTLIFFIFTLALIFSNGVKESDTSIALFIPGIVNGSPVYEMLAEGVKQATEEYKVSLTVIEAGTNQAEWSSKLTALCATGKYNVIISSNPSLPDLVAPLSKKFKKQKFILLDAYLEGNEAVATIRYNQKEQAYLAGYAAGLVTTSKNMKYANREKKIALIAGQEYPVMNTIILPSFVEGAKKADKDITVDFRIVGNWFDAAKGADIAQSLYRNDVDVILPIAGGASQGVLAAAKEHGFYISWFDDNGFSKAPGYVISSSVMEQKQMAYEQTIQFLEGNTHFGKAKTVGIEDGYIEFILNDEHFLKTVPQDIQNKLIDVYGRIKNGSIILTP